MFGIESIGDTALEMAEKVEIAETIKFKTMIDLRSGLIEAGIPHHVVDSFIGKIKIEVTDGAAEAYPGTLEKLVASTATILGKIYDALLMADDEKPIDAATVLSDMASEMEITLS
jgi:hypothetical protein